MRKESKPVYTFRCPIWMIDEIKKKVTKTVLNNSTEDTLFKYSRTDLILESLQKWNNFQKKEETI